MSAASLFTKMVTLNKHIMHNTKNIQYIINTFSKFTFILSYFVAFAYCDENIKIAGSSIDMNGYENRIPKVTLGQVDELIKVDTTMNDLEIIKDSGGKLSAFAITEIGSDYKNALEIFYTEAPKCIGRNIDHINIPHEVQLPDGSTRRTFATESKQYPKCVHMNLLSRAFDEIDHRVSKLLKKLHHDEDLGYMEKDNITFLSHAPVKDHIHIYTKESARHQVIKDHSNQNHETEYLVPYHVDNGIYLLLTPFPNHGLEVKLSNGQKVSTNDIDSESILVLMGRGLTDWLLQLSDKGLCYATPHAVPSLGGSDISTRSVYARMKVAPGSAVPISDDPSVVKRELKTFEDVFMETSEQSHHGVGELCSVNLKEEMNPMHDFSHDVWSHAMDSLCGAGEAYCWMSCRPLPSKCPNADQARCYSSEKNISCG